MTTPNGPQAAPDSAYAGAPDMEAEASALVALAAALNGSVDRSAAAVRPLAVRKAAWLDRAALAEPENERAARLADTAARELLAHDGAFGPGPNPTADDWVGPPALRPGRLPRAPRRRLIRPALPAPPRPALYVIPLTYRAGR
jgi:hypothetical protein